MNTRQILKYAQDNGYNSTMFAIKNRDDKQICVGKFLDAYYEFVNIPVLGEGFLRIKNLEEQLGYDIGFEVIDEQKYNAGAYLDFLLRGKEIPQPIIDSFKTTCE